jgi:hypothetical protein
MSITSEQASEGYVGEMIPVTIKISNKDDRELFFRLSVFLPPGEEEDGESTSPFFTIPVS